MYINLSTGKTISVSAFQYYFILKEEDVDSFFQDCVADDLGDEINNPFSRRCSNGKIILTEEDSNEEESETDE